MHFGELDRVADLRYFSVVSFMLLNFVSVLGPFDRRVILLRPRPSCVCPISLVGGGRPLVSNSRVNKTAGGNDGRWLGSSSSSFFPFLLFRTLPLSLSRLSPLRAVPLRPSQSYRSFFSAASVSSASQGALLSLPLSAISLSLCMIHGRTELYNLGLGIGASSR